MRRRNPVSRLPGVSFLTTEDAASLLRERPELAKRLPGSLRIARSLRRARLEGSADPLLQPGDLGPGTAHAVLLERVVPGRTESGFEFAGETGTVGL